MSNNSIPIKYVVLLLLNHKYYLLYVLGTLDDCPREMRLHVALVVGCNLGNGESNVFKSDQRLYERFCKLESKCANTGSSDPKP